MSKENMLQLKLDLSDIIDYAMRDWDDYIDECREEEIPPIDTFEEYIADSVIDAGYRKQEWISVNERLPEEGKNVLCVEGNKMMIAFMEKFEDCGTFVPVFWDWVAYDRDDTWNEVCPTHWMPLPEPPKGE